MRKWFFLLLAVAPLVGAMKHPMHVSVTDIEVDEDDKALKVVTHIFLDDIEQRYRAEKGNNELDITTEEIKPDFKLFLGEYINQSLKFNINGKLINLFSLLQSTGPTTGIL